MHNSSFEHVPNVQQRLILCNPRAIPHVLTIFNINQSYEFVAMLFHSRQRQSRSLSITNEQTCLVLPYVIPLTKRNDSSSTILPYGEVLYKFYEIPLINYAVMKESQVSSQASTDSSVSPGGTYPGIKCDFHTSKIQPWIIVLNTIQTQQISVKMLSIQFVLYLQKPRPW